MSAFRPVCPAARLPIGRAVTALVDGEQVAVLRTADDRLQAVSPSGAVHLVRVRDGVVEVALHGEALTA